jgi:microcin C transport system permease protein
MRFAFDPQTLRRIKKFRRIGRGWYSLLLIATIFVVSLGAEMFIGNRPLIVSYQGATYFPAFTDKYYSAQLFGSAADMETDFRALEESESFRAAGGFLILPIHPFSPIESIRVPGDPPPSRPSLRHPMGTDDRGRDILARVVYGFRTSVSFALVVTLGAYVLGISVGAMQGFFGGRVDLVLQRFTEIWSALPFLYVVTLLASIVTPTFPMLVGILIVFTWIGISHYTRAEVYKERNKDYVTAARALGASWHGTLFRHVLPNALTPAITLFPLALVSDIFALTALDFLGYGLPAPTPSWGELFSQGRTNIRSWWLITFPFLALASTLLLLTFVGEGIREAWDPRDSHVRQDDTTVPLLQRIWRRIRRA